MLTIPSSPLPFPGLPPPPIPYAVRPPTALNDASDGASNDASDNASDQTGVAHCYTLTMTTVAHRELRNNSADLLRRAAAGESFEVTNNGRVVAMLVPPQTSPLERRLAAQLVPHPTATRLPRIARVRSTTPTADLLAKLTTGDYDKRLKVLKVGQDKAGKDRRIKMPDVTATFL